ncbi:hypothetical protein Patl1_20238 [Pistacia atlantica]|uniref:Uncharacterized protein n=1 Tax=Pistacia atlantica TaxID=434234 RepID=A0ACC1BM73_9ROSI|nr:hypothetical protein Patl1_20238 [Pistacia atlantica]
MPLKDVASWTGILSAYVKNKKHYEALDLFYCMMISGQYPNEFTFSSVLRSCSALGEFNYGTRVQSYVIKYGFQSNPFSGSALIDLYSKWGFTNEAYKLFTCMENGDTVSWTTMISSFVKERNWSRALQFYVHMIEAGVHPNEFTYVKILAASCFLGLSYGRLVHGHMIVRGVKMNVVLKTALVDMYSRCQRMEDAIKVSNLTPEYDVLLWTTIISGFTQNLKFREAVAAFHDMEVCGVAPNNFTYSSILGACSSVLSLDLGRQIHSRVIMAGLEDDVSVGNALVDMYLKCSSVIESGLTAFRVISSPNVISWTSLIAGFVEHGFHQEAFQLFEEMQASGVQPNSFTISSILGACSTVESVSQLSKIHGCAIKTEVDDDIVVGNALVDAYAGLGLVDDAWQVISKMSHRDAAAYTSLATRMNQMGHHEAALNIITHMYNDNIKMDGFSLASFIAASASLAGEEIGKQLHCHSMKSGLVCWISVSNSLVDLYGKSGYLSDAHTMMRERALMNPEPSSMEYGNKIHLFIAGHAEDGAAAYSVFQPSKYMKDSYNYNLYAEITFNILFLVTTDMDHGEHCEPWKMISFLHDECFCRAIGSLNSGTRLSKTLWISSQSGLMKFQEALAPVNFWKILELTAQLELFPAFGELGKGKKEGNSEVSCSGFRFVKSVAQMPYK